MPITITLPTNGGHFGPGFFIDATSDIPVADPGTREWFVAIAGESGRTVIQGFAFEHGASLRQVFLVNNGLSNLTLNFIGQLPANGEPASVQIEHSDNGVISGQATMPIVWDGSSQIGTQAYLTPRGTAGGGFTASDRQMLTDAERRTQTIGEPTDLVVDSTLGPQILTVAQLLARRLLSDLTFEEITAGPTADTVVHSFSAWYYGVVVRVTTIREDLLPHTPDSSWYYPDLAVLRIFRGNDLLFRRGIHTPTFMTDHPWEWGSQFLNFFEVLGLPPDLTIFVDWLDGCAGQVFLQRLP